MALLNNLGNGLVSLNGTTGQNKKGVTAGAATSSGSTGKSSGGKITIRSGSTGSGQSGSKSTRGNKQNNFITYNSPVANSMRIQQERAIVQGLVQQHPEIVQRAYDNVQNSYMTAFNVMAGQERTQQHRMIANNALQNLNKSLQALGTIQSAFRMYGNEDQVSQVMTAATDGYKAMQKDFEERYGKWELPQEEDSGERGFGAWAKNAGEAAAKSTAGGYVGGFATAMQGISENVMDYENQYEIERARREEEAARIQDERQWYIGESQKRGYAPAAAVLADYDAQLEALNLDGLQQEYAEAQAQGAQERARLYEQANALADESAAAQQEAKDIANRNAILSRPMATGRLGSWLGMDQMTIGDMLTDASVAGAEMMGDVAIGTVTGGGSMLPMVLRTFGAGASEAARNGADVNEQIFQGVKQAAIEWVTEKLFAGNPLYDQGGGWVTDAVYNTLYKRFGAETMDRLFSTAAARIAKIPMAMMSEGVEEVLSDLFNPLVDWTANQIDGGNRDTSLASRGDFVKDFLVGAALGGFGNVTEAASGAVQNAAATMQAGRTIRQNNAQEALQDVAGYVGQDVDLGRGRAVDLGRAFNQVQEAYTSQAVENRLADLGAETSPALTEAVKRMAEDKALSREQQAAYFGSFSQARQVMQEYKAAMSGDVNADNFWAYDSLIRAEDLAPAETGEQTAPEDETAPEREAQPETAPEETAPEQIESQPVLQEPAAQETQPAVNAADAVRAEVAALAQEENVETAFGQKSFELTQRMQQTSDPAEREALQDTLRNMNDIADAVNQAPADQRAEVLRGIINNVYGGTINGREGNRVSDAEGRRDDGARAEVEAGTVRSGENGNDGGRAADRGWNRVVPAADQSAAQIGIRNGTDAVRNSVLPEAEWTDDLKDLAGRIRARGLDPVFVRGTMELRDPATDQIHHVSGCWESERVFIQTDNRLYSAQQIADHEIMHDRIAEDPAMLEEIIVRMDLTDEQIERIAAQYAKTFGFVYGEVTESMTADEQQALYRMYLEEFVCDAAAGLNRIGVRGTVTPSRFADVANDVVREREGMGNGSGGMPGSRYMSVGESAQTANLQDLAAARAMEDQGASSEEIRQGTGWYKGYDGKWRFEISDADMKMHLRGDARFRQDHPAYARYQELMDKLLMLGETSMTDEEQSELQRLDRMWGRELSRLGEIVDSGNATLDMILDHPALFEAYPQLKDMRVKFSDMEPGTNGYFDGNQIALNSELKKSTSKLMDTLVHEIQHAVQQIEGFARGSNQSYWQYKQSLEQKGLQELKNQKMQLAEEMDNLNELIRKIRQDIGFNRHLFDATMEFAEDVQAGRFPDRGEAYEQRKKEVLQGVMAWAHEASPELQQAEERIEDCLNEMDMIDAQIQKASPLSRKSSFQLYRNTTGEIEARDTAARRSMTDEERRNTRPDIDRADVVFAEDAGTSYSIGRNAERKRFVQIEEDILEGVPEENWIDTVKKELSSRYPDGIILPSGTVKVNRKTRGELTRSKDTMRMMRETPEYREDKFRSTANLDEILRIAENWVDEEPRDNSAKFTNLGRGEVLLRIGDRDYSAEVLVGTDKTGAMVMYDIVNMARINEETDADTVESPKGSLHRRTSDSKYSISDSSENSNTEFGKPVTRFSMADEIEETPDLVALHNVTEEKLRSIMELGGLPMPSIAIVKAADGHAKYGPITFLFDKSTIDPQADRRNRVYGSDAWTPTSVDVNYKVDDDRVYDIEQRMNDLASRVAGGIFSNTSLIRQYGISEFTTKSLPEIANQLSNNEGAMAAYAAAHGIEVEPEYRAPEYHAFGNDFVRKIIEAVGADRIQNMEAWDLAPEDQQIFRDLYREEQLERLGARYLQNGKTMEQIQAAADRFMQNFGENNINKMIRAAQEMIRNEESGELTEVDRLATADKLRATVDRKDVARWLEGELDGILGERGIRNSRDQYTPSGNRRSFKQLHDAYTLENIVKAMASQQSARGQNAMATASGLQSVSSPEYRSIQEIRADRHRLGPVETEEYRETMRKMGDRIEAFEQDVLATNDAERDFTARQVIEELMIQGAGTDRSVLQLMRLFTRESEYSLSPEQAKELGEIYEEAAALPTEYFEAKPQRAVRFDEVKTAIVPDNVSQDIRDGLQRFGVPMEEYEHGNEEDRLRVLNTHADMRFSVAEDAGEIGETAYDEQQRAQLLANVEALAPKDLRRALTADRAELQTMEKLAKQGGLTADARRTLPELRRRVDAEQSRLKEVERKTREERAAAKERQEKRQTPRRAREDFIRDVLDHFSVREGRGESGEILGRFFDRAREQGRINDADKTELFRKLVDSGTVRVEAESSARAIRGDLAHTRIFVPEDVRGDFGDNYELLRREAFANGIILTSDPRDNQIDVLNMDLADRFPGTFRTDMLDRGMMLQNIVDAAGQGRAENISFMEMLERNEDTEGWSVDEQLDAEMNWLDARIDKALYAAGIEVETRTRSALQLAKERAERREVVQRQAEQKALREQQHKTMNALRWLKKNRQRAPEELRTRYDEVLSDINLYTMSAANEMRWSDKHQATYGDLVEMYKKARKDDPNWLPSKELEKLMSMVDGRAVAEMNIDELDTLYKAAVALRTEFYNRNNVINDEMHRTFSEVYRDSSDEIQASAGKGNLGEKLGKLTGAEMLTPMNQLRRMAGWKQNGVFESIGKGLQAGERAKKGYTVRARAMLEEFTESHQDWIRRADGQGKDAIWYEIEVPELLELHMGDKPIFGNTVKVYMTPMQKVQLYIESKNHQNLQHMTGGRTFVNRELYAQGKNKEALAQGTTVRLAPETVKRLVSDLTEEEQELANLLERYYNGMAKEEINRVSNALYGYDKAMIDHYAPIFTDANYNKSTAGLFDVTAEGVGHMKSREQVSKNPSYNLSAIDAFEKHIDQTSRFVGLAIPVRNMETLLNWYGDGTTMKKTISQMWGAEGVKYIEDLLTELQSPTIPERSAIQMLGDKAVSNYISAVFGANPGIVLKQAASYPAAAAVLGFGNMPSVRQLANIDEDLIGKYTPELAYRKMGLATPEIAELRKNPSPLDRNKITRFMLRGGAITWMDQATVRNLWPWAENYVRKNFPDLEIGDQATVEAGLSPFYRKVAEAFNEAVNTTQPMYDTMNRAKIMTHDNLLTRTFTLFKTVPLQEYNTLARFAGEAKGRGKAGRQAVAGAIASVLVSTLSLEAVEALNALVKNGLKRYRDDDDELTAESFAKTFGLNIAKDLAGIMIGGSEIFEAITNHFGLGGYSSDFSIIGAEQINEIRDTLSSAAGLLERTIGGAFDIAQNGGSVGAYLKRNRGDLLGGIHDLAVAFGKYAEGLPIENIEKYLGGILAAAWPDAKAAIAGTFDTTTKTDLSYISDREMPRRLNDLLNIRGIEADDGTSDELARLYLSGYKIAVPADTPKEIGDRELSAYERQVYDNAYSQTIGKRLDELIESDAYIEADDESRAEMLQSLYTFANETAKLEVDPDYEISSTNAWVNKAMQAEESGVEAVTYIQARAAMKAADAANDDNGTIKQVEAETALRGMDLTDEQRAVLWQLTNASWKPENNPFAGGPSKMEDAGDYAAAGSTSGTTAAAPAAAPAAAQEEAPDPTDRTYLRSLYADLTPPEGMDKVTQTQKYRAIVDAFDSVNDQIAALETEMSEGEIEKIQIGYSRSVTPEMYVASKEAMYAQDDAGDNNNSTSQMEAKYALDGMDLTDSQKAVLWQLANKSWKPYSNPYDTDIGQAVYDELHGAPLQNPAPTEEPQPETPYAGLNFQLPTADLPSYN